MKTKFALLATCAAVTASFAACSKAPPPSAVKDIIARNPNVIFYRTTSPHFDFIVRKFCPPQDVTPTKNCEQFDRETHVELPPMMLLAVRDFQANVAENLGANEAIYFQQNGTARLNAEIADLEGFLRQPTLTDGEIAEAQKNLARLLQLRSLKTRVDSVLTSVSTNDSVSLPAFSEDFKVLNRTFDGRNEKLYVYDRTNGLWWASLGYRNFYDATGQGRPMGGTFSPTGPVGTSCAQQFGAGYRIPGFGEAERLIRQSASYSHLQRAFGDVGSAWTEGGYSIYDSTNPYSRTYPKREWDLSKVKLTLCVAPAR